MKINLRRCLLWLALPVLLVGLAVWSWTPSEPSWEGRSLSSWLKDLEPRTIDKLGTVGEQNAEAAKRAIQGMGTNCLPFLLRRLEHLQPTPLEQKLVMLEDQLGGNKIKLPWGGTEARINSRNFALGLAFETLGHQAAPIVSEMQRWLCVTNAHKDSIGANVLAYIHPEGTVALIAASTNRTIPSRLAVFHEKAVKWEVIGT